MPVFKERDPLRGPFKVALQRAARSLSALHERRVHAPRVNRIVEALGTLVGQADSILDIGAGDGTLAVALARRVGASRIEGVDVLVRPHAAIPVQAYDGTTLPYPDDAFACVVLSDVLHHCEDPRAVLREALRVARCGVALKDHFRFGLASQLMLTALDRAGNAGPGVLVRATYFSPVEWIEMVGAAGGYVAKLVWPLQIHDEPIRRFTRDELQFAALLAPNPRA